jgi:Glyoxalase-like domain
MGRNRIHLDLTTTWGGDRLHSLGTTEADIRQGSAGWVIMSDPDGNEFCVLNPRVQGALGEGIARLMISQRV